MQDNGIGLDIEQLGAAVRACLHMGPLRTSDPYLYHEFGFNCDVASLSDADKASIHEVFDMMREIAGEMRRRGETADSFLAED
ncbi:MAG: hypothetical protein NWP69_09650 [Congregibacter sp.]|nr:hypothetical protein [Congregibacter sp.]